MNPKLFYITIINLTLVKTSSFNPDSMKVSEILKEVFQKVQSNELSINLKCIEQLGCFLENLIVNGDDDIWALKMIDASTKFPSGILKLNTGGWLGSFDECLEIKSTKKDVQGKYCLGSLATQDIKSQNYIEQKLFSTYNYTRAFRKAKEIDLGDLPMAILPSFGICVPNQCASEDIESVLSIFNTDITLAFKCQIKEDTERTLDSSAIAVIIGFAFFIAFMMLSTMFDFHCSYYKTEPFHPLLLAFSVYTNGKQVFKISSNKVELSCLHGIRFLSMLWVIVGHTLYIMATGPLVNYTDVFRWLNTKKSMVFVNGVFSVDTFLVITGLLVVYAFMKAMSQGLKFNVLIFYLHRYIRLTPSFLAVIVTNIALIKYMGSGPHWSQIEEHLQDNCKESWWRAILYVQNYFGGGKWCIPQTWYLNVDWQLYLISPLFLLTLHHKPKIGVGLVCLAIISFMCSAYVVTWDNQLPAFIAASNGDIKEFTTKYYQKTHTRAAPWFIGALAGYFIGKNKFQQKLPFLKMNKWLVLIIWVVVLTLVPVIIFVGHDELMTSTEYNAVGNALYNAFTRPLWGFCIAWIIFACVNGYGGFINHMLSLQIFQVLNRFTYSMYLVHFTILYLITFSLKTPGYFSIFNVVLSFWGVFMLSFGLSIFCVLAFESPIIVMEKYFLDKFANKKKPENRLP